MASQNSQHNLGRVLRIIILGPRWSGKSFTGNTIIGEAKFECGRIRTAECEIRHGVVAGHQLTVADSPGWKEFLSDTSERDKQQMKLGISRCYPGPHVFLLAVPIDTAFTEQRKQLMMEHLKLFGETVWQYSMVIFTCGDYLQEDTTIEEHIVSEGMALQDLVKRCDHRYHVFNNKDKTNTSQVSKLLEKIEQLVDKNHGGYYNVDETTVQRISEKQIRVKERAENRHLENVRQREELKLAMKSHGPLTELRIVLLGSRNVGKSSSAETILGSKELKAGKRTASCVVACGSVGQTALTIIDTPGWWKGYKVMDTTERIKQELMRSPFLCPPGPHVFLLVIDADASFTERHLSAVHSHLELLGGKIWQHTIVLFSGGDWLGKKTIEEHIEEEGDALQSLVDKCGNRYHVLDNRNAEECAQVTELLEKIKEMVVGNEGEHFESDEKIFKILEEKKHTVEEAAKQRQLEMNKQRQSFKGCSKDLDDIKIVLVGQKAVGKSATGNTILGREEFPIIDDTICNTGKGVVHGRKVFIVDTPGWFEKPSLCKLELDNEIVKGVSLCQPGPHALLLVIPLDLAFKWEQMCCLADHLSLFGEDIWRHTIVVFTHGDMLEEPSIEQHIQRESFLQVIVEQCQNRYHVINNYSAGESKQVLELLMKIEEMVTANAGQHFIQNMIETHKRVEDKFLRGKLTEFMSEEWKKREVALKMEFRHFLNELLQDVQGGEAIPSKNMEEEKSRRVSHDQIIFPKLKSKSLLRQSKESKRREETKEKLIAKLKSLDSEIQTRGSYELPPPSFSEGSIRTVESLFRPNRTVLAWLSSRHTDMSSGYSTWAGPGEETTKQKLRDIF